MNATAREALTVARSIIDTRHDHIEDRDDVKWYMEELAVPDHLWDRVWSVVCAELGL